MSGIAESASGTLSRRKAKKEKKISAIKKSKDAFLSVDGQVQHTNDDSVVSKRSAVLHGYLEDPFLRVFVKAKTRRSPLINRGYFLRMKVITDLITACIDVLAKKNMSPIQVISLGAGYDTLAMRCLLQGERRAFYEQRTQFYDVDFPAVMRSKSVLMNAATTTGLFPPDWILQPGDETVFVQSPYYRAVGVDLRRASSDLLSSLKKASETFSSAHLTIIYAECVTQYMSEEASTALLKLLASSFPNSVFFAYDQLNSNDSFGRVMEQSLKTRNSPLLGIRKLGNGVEMTQRALQCDMKKSFFANFYDLGRFYFPLEETHRLDALEPFDEEEEWSEMCEHYGITMAQTLDSFPEEWHPCFLSSSALQAEHGSLVSSSVQSTVLSWPSGRFRFERWGFGSIAASPLPDGDVMFVGFGGFSAGKNHGRTSSIYCHSLKRGDVEVVIATPGDTHNRHPDALMFHSFSQLSLSQYLVIGGRTNPKDVSSVIYLLTLHGMESHQNIISGTWSLLDATVTGDSQSIDGCPQARFRHTAVTLSSNSSSSYQVFLYGGRNAQGRLLGDAWIGTVDVDSLQLQWSGINLRGAVPKPCCSSAAVFHNQRILLTGGLLEGNRASGLLTSVDIQTGECVQEGASVGGRYSHSATVVVFKQKEYLLVLGGSVCTPKSTVEPAVLIPLNDLTSSVPLRLPEEAATLWWSRHDCVTMGDGVVGIIGGGYTCFSFGTFVSKPLLLLLDGAVYSNPLLSSSTLSTAVGSSRKLLATSFKEPKEGAYSPATFLEVVHAASQPVLFRNVDFGPCVTQWKSPSYLSEVEKDLIVSVHVAVNTTVLDFVHKNFSFRHLSFPQMIQQMVECTERSRRGSSVAESAETLYFRSVSSHMKTERSNLWKDFPQIGKDFHLPSGASEYILPRMHQACWRINPSPLTLWMHYDTLDNVLCQVVGRKRVTLFPPSQYNNLYMVDSSSLLLSLNEIDLSQFPRYIDASKHGVQVILNPGDMLFIPAMWFHHIETMDNADDLYSVSVNVFYEHFETEAYDKKDLYGNKDLPAFQALRSSIVSHATNLVKEQETQCKVPSDIRYTEFALREAIQDLEVLAASLAAKQTC